MSLSDFQQYLHDNFDVDANMLKFKCVVTYSSVKGTISASTSARMLTGTMDWGEIQLDEVGDIRAEDYHLSFNPKWGTFHFDKSHSALVIEGKSPKMGSYKVVVTPTGT